MKKETTVICIGNFKGGISKSSSATALQSILNDMGHKTLLIDTDASCNATDTLRAQTKDTGTLFDVMLDYDYPLPINDAIQHTENGDIVASDPMLEEADARFRRDGSEYFRLSEALEGLKGYEYVIFDTAPTNTIVFKNALVASNYLIIPITTDRYAIQGLASLYKTIRSIQKYNNPNLKIAGLLLTRYKPRQTLAKSAHESLESIAQQMNTKLFNTYIRECVAVQKAQAARELLIRYDKNCTAAQDYRSFTEELLEEINED